MSVKKMVCLFAAFLMLCMSTVSVAESAGTLTINLSTATDEELADAAALIKAEQRARLKTSIQFDVTEFTLNKGSTRKVSASVIDLPDGVKAGKLTWSSSDESVATCSNGTVKGTGAGHAVITCTSVLSDGTEVSADIAVIGQLPVKSLAFSGKQLEMMAGDVLKPEVIVTPEDATNKEYTLTSSDEKAVRVDENGQLVAGLNGKAVITATANDGSGKTAKINVTVVRKVGKYDDELTFQGLEWGIDYVTAYKALAEAGLVESKDNPHAYNTSWLHYWPEEDLLFADSGSWSDVPVALKDHSMGIMELSISSNSLLKKIGGYTPRSLELYFLNPIENGKINTEKSELCGVYLYFDNDHEKGTDIFTNLLGKMEAQYGEFTRYLAKDLTRRYYKDMYDGIKDAMAGAKMFGWRDYKKTRDIYLSDYAICTLKGKNDTGIALLVSSSEYTTLFYGKLDTLDRIQKIQEVLEQIPDDKEDAGI